MFREPDHTHPNFQRTDCLFEAVFTLRNFMSKPQITAFFENTKPRGTCILIRYFKVVSNIQLLISNVKQFFEGILEPPAINAGGQK
jgi:hypothetical protein